MRSIFGKILLWFSGMLVLAVVSFVAVSIYVSPERTHDRFSATLALQLDAARSAYELGGRADLEAYFSRLPALFPGRFYLTDASARDVLTGEDRAALAAEARAPRRWPIPRGDIVLARATDDGRYQLLVVLQPPSDPLTPLPYFAWIPLAIGILCYVLAVHLATPARRLRDIVERFGRGDLSARANFARKDEFGDLGRAFDQMAGRIEQLVAEQRRLLQDISHELRSPLTRLGYAVELARTGSNREEAFARTKKEVGRLTTLVTALLEATRADGELVRRVEDVALGDLAAAVVDDCATEAATRPCQLGLSVSDPVTVLAAPDMIRRAVENVLYNAISHAPAGSTVDVTVARSADHGTITIRDRGPGVPDEHLDDIFKPFFRVDTDRNRETGGVGLGLAIARSAVSLHHGRISARNADPGLEVLIELPV